MRDEICCAELLSAKSPLRTTPLSVLFLHWFVFPLTRLSSVITDYDFLQAPVISLLHLIKKMCVWEGCSGGGGSVTHQETFVLEKQKLANKN